MGRWPAAFFLGFVLGCSSVESSTPRVVLVQPSGPEVPENLLRISVRFTTQIQGPLLRRIALLRADGSEIQEPFLEQELWTPDGKTLTLLLHPGRIKSGLTARTQLGPILPLGEHVFLALDDIAIKGWRVGPSDETGPVTSAWKIYAVAPGSWQRMIIALDAPIDGQDAGYLAIVDSSGRRVPGRGRLTRGEGKWTFTPDAPWKAGMYKLVVRGTLEDPAGNRPGSHFETSIYSPPDSTADVTVPFGIGPVFSSARD